MQVYIKTLLIMIFSLTIASYSMAMESQLKKSQTVLNSWIDCEHNNLYDACNKKNCKTCNEGEYFKVLEKHLKLEQQVKPKKK